MPLGLQLGVGIGDGSLLRHLLRERGLPGILDGGCRAVAVALDAFGKTHVYALASAARNFFRSLATVCAVTSDLARSRTAREKSHLPSASTAGLPLLTDTGTARSLGTSCRTPISSADSTSFRCIPTFELARFSTTLIRSCGNESSSRVCSDRRTFLIVGTSRLVRRRNSAVRSRVA